MVDFAGPVIFSLTSHNEESEAMFFTKSEMLQDNSILTRNSQWVNDGIVKSYTIAILLWQGDTLRITKVACMH